MKPSLLWLASHFFHPSGHAEEVRGFLRALEADGHSPSARDLHGRRPKPTDDPLNVELTRQDLTMLDRQLARRPRLPCVAVHHYVPRSGHKPIRGMVNVARAMFETDRVPAGWSTLLSSWDEIWVPSRHNLDIFLNGGIGAERLRLIEQTIDFAAFRPDVEPYPLQAPDGHFVFLAVFDFSERKGWRQLLEAWSRAFHPHDPVCLVLKTGSVANFKARFVRDVIRDFLDRGIRSRRAAPVRVITDMLPAEDIPRLYAAADAYVSASRGEAWGRSYMEAMAMGLPTIGTRYGGNLDFMSDQNSWLVDGTLVPVRDGHHLLNGLYRGHRWFEVDIEELVRVLGSVASDPPAARQKASSARTELIARFGGDVIAKRVMALADAAVQRHGGRRWRLRFPGVSRKRLYKAAQGSDHSRRRH